MNRKRAIQPSCPRFPYQELLLPQNGLLHEKESPYLLLKERHLQVLWLEQRGFKPLVTSGGERVEVLSSGIWNLSAGPDFLKAHLRIGGRELRGDVEIHLSEISWEQHGHHLDPRYQGVILHIVLWKPKQSSSHKAIPVVYLEEQFDTPLSSLVQGIDLDLYPYHRFVGSGRCARTLFSTLPSQQILELFQAASEWRLQEKGRFLAALSPMRSLRLLCGLAMALGYTKNQQTFLALFSWLWPQRSLDQQTLLALAMGTSGLFQTDYNARWGVSPAYRELLACWQRIAPPDAPSFALDIGKQRPYHHPLRRLVYLSYLLRDGSAPEWLNRLELCWEQLWKTASGPKELRQLQQELAAVIPSYSDPYWNRHFTFEATPQPRPVPLASDELKQLVLVNCAFPLIYEGVIQRGERAELEVFWKLYALLKAPESGKQRCLTHRFFGETLNGGLLDYSALEQGAFQLHKDFCLHYEASCEGCPFVERALIQFAQKETSCI